MFIAEVLAVNADEKYFDKKMGFFSDKNKKQQNNGSIISKKFCN